MFLTLTSAILKLHPLSLELKWRAISTATFLDLSCALLCHMRKSKGSLNWNTTLCIIWNPLKTRYTRAMVLHQNQGCVRMKCMLMSLSTARSQWIRNSATQHWSNEEDICTPFKVGQELDVRYGLTLSCVTWNIYIDKLWSVLRLGMRSYRTIQVM